MKNILKKSLVIFAMLASVLGATSLATTAPTYADSGREFGSCNETLGLVPWDCGVAKNPDSEDELKDSALTIATNVARDISVIAAYLVIGYVIYGGYLYIFAAGDVGKLAAGKKTILHAFIGLAIVGLVNIAVRSIHIALLGKTGTFDANCVEAQCIRPEDLVNNMIKWFIGVAGVVSAIYVVIGGIGYMTSSGDAGKLQKAKNTIFYALIGLAIVAISLVADSFVTDLINKAAAEGSDFRDTVPIILNGIIGIAGTVCVVYVVLGGARYITSTGDPGKLKKAKDTIIYACIGLVICAFAFAIVNFAIRSINGENDKTTISDTSLLEKPIALLEEKL